MPEWIDAKERIPEMFGKYFCKRGERAEYKEVLSLQSIQVYYEKGVTIVWLDETISHEKKEEKPAPQSITKNLKIFFNVR